MDVDRAGRSFSRRDMDVKCLLPWPHVFLTSQEFLGRGAGVSTGAAEEAAALCYRKRPRSRGRNGRPQLQNLQDRRPDRLVRSKRLSRVKENLKQTLQIEDEL